MMHTCKECQRAQSWSQFTDDICDSCWEIKNLNKNMNIIIIDSSNGAVYKTTVDAEQHDDIEEVLDAKLEKIGARLKDCEWMQLTSEEIQTI